MPFEIVGVVADDHHVAVDADPTPTFFLPYRHTPGPGEIAVTARGEGDTTHIVGGLRSVIRHLDPEMSFYRVQTMEQIVDASVARRVRWRGCCPASQYLVKETCGPDAAGTYSVRTDFVRSSREHGKRFAKASVGGRDMDQVKRACSVTAAPGWGPARVAKGSAEGFLRQR